TAVAALSIVYPASVQAVPTTYQYTGNPFTYVTGVYTTSDFVTAMVTLASPLGANMPLTQVTPTAFTLSDGVQTISNLNAIFAAAFFFATNASGGIAAWYVFVRIAPTQEGGSILTATPPLAFTHDRADYAKHGGHSIAEVDQHAGRWV